MKILVFIPFFLSLLAPFSYAHHHFYMTEQVLPGSTTGPPEENILQSRD